MILAFSRVGRAERSGHRGPGSSCDVAGGVCLENLIDSSFVLLGHLRSYVLDATEISRPNFHRRIEMFEETFDSRVFTTQIRIH